MTLCIKTSYVRDPLLLNGDLISLPSFLYRPVDVRPTVPILLCQLINSRVGLTKTLYAAVCVL